MKRVLMVVPDSAWPEGGNVTTAERIAQWILPLGWAVDVIPVADLEQGVKGGGVSLLHAIHCRKSGIAVARVAHANHLPYVVTFSGTDVTDLLDPSTRPALQGVMRSAAALTVFHEDDRRRIVAAVPRMAPLVHVVWPGTERLPGTADRARWGLDDKDLVFLLPAGLRDVKRPRFAIAPLQAVRGRFPRLRLVIAGPPMDAACVRQLEADLATRPWARWLGPVPHHAMGSLYQSADVVLNTSTAEGLSNAIMEALALGRPLLVSDNTGNRQALGACAPAGIIFGDAETFATAAGDLAGDPALRHRLGQAALARAAVFDPRRETAAYAGIYSAALQDMHRDVLP